MPQSKTTYLPISWVYHIKHKSCFPSTWEGLGIVAIEAQASGLECYLSRELPKEVEVTDAVTWFDVSENENAIANMIDLTKVPEETRYIRNREVAENGSRQSAHQKQLQSLQK